MFVKPEPDPEEPAITVEKWSSEQKAELQGNLELFLNMRDIGQSMLLGAIAGQPAAEFEMDQAQMNHLARVYTPVFKKLGGKIPDVVWVVMAEGMIMAPLITKAIKAGSVNRANKKLAAQPGIQHRIDAAAAQVSRRPRKNYTIDDMGRYVGDAVNNKYIKVANRVEMASLEDIEHLMRDNDLGTLQKAFPEANLILPAGDA